VRLVLQISQCCVQNNESANTWICFLQELVPSCSKDLKLVGKWLWFCLIVHVLLLFSNRECHLLLALIRNPNVWTSKMSHKIWCTRTLVHDLRQFLGRYFYVWDMLWTSILLEIYLTQNIATLQGERVCGVETNPFHISLIFLKHGLCYLYSLKQAPTVTVFHLY